MERMVVNMQNETLPYRQRLEAVQRRRRHWLHIVRILTALVVFCTTYALILPALTMTQKTYCGLEAHVHEEACYDADGQLICTLPEHTHTRVCYANPEADTETAAQWEAMLQDAAVYDSARQNLLAVAETQRGYQESEKNYIMDDVDVQRGYTRYGAWAGTPYADWNALFVSFCCYYAGVHADGLATTFDGGAWHLSADDAPLSTDYDNVAPGDLLLLDSDGDETADRIAVVTGFDGTMFAALSGDEDGAVAGVSYEADDPAICGCILLEEAETMPLLQTQEDTQPEPEETTVSAKTPALRAPQRAPLLEATGENTSGVKASGSVNNNMTWTLYEDGELVISGTGGMNVVPWRPTYNDAIKKVTIEEGVTSVGNSAFSGCENLTEVSLPSTLTTIGDSAFQDCTGLTEMQFPAALTSVGRNGFNGCTALASIDFPADGNINRLYPAAFYGCTSLTAVSIPASMQILDTSAFGNCSALETVDFAEGSVLTRVVNATFQNCTSLRSITLPPTVTELSQNTFNGCTSLESVTLSPKLTSIGIGAFSGCTSLTEVIFPEGSVLTSLSNGAFQNCSSLETITLPDSLTTLGSTVFSGCTSLTTVGVPDSLTAIGSSAFSNCTSLSSFRFPASLRTIDNAAFYNTAALEEADFSACSSLTTLGQSAFYQSGIKTLDLSNCSSLTSIPAYCFELCKNLETVDLTGCTALTTVGYRAFEGDSALKGIDFSSCTALKSFDSQVFSECSNLQYANFTGCTSLTTFAAQDFQYCSKLESIDFSGCTNLTSFSYDNFRGCSSLRYVSFAGCEKLTSIGRGSFASCSALETVDLSGCVSLKSLEQSVFQNCPSLRSVDLSGCTSIKSIDNSAFYNCSSLQEIDLSDCSGITTIGPSAFSGCSSLREIDLSGMTSLTSIGSSAFYNCSNLQTVDLTDCSALTTIGSSAFERCSRLSNVILDGCTSLKTIGSMAFSGCTALHTIDFSAARNSLTALNSRAFAGSGLVEIDLHDFEKLTTVGIACFDGCQKLEVVNFNGCTALKDLGGSSYTNARQFYNTGVLRLVDLRGCTSLESIGSEAFSTTRTTCTFLLDGCTSLKYIYSDAFAGHGAAVELDLSQLSSLELIGSNAFVRGKFIGTLVIPKKVKTIGSSAFGNNTGYGNWNQFSKIDLSKSESLETIGSYAFGYLPVREVDFSGCTSLVSIGTGAFRNDLALKTADLSNCVSLTTIGDAAFRDCTALEEVTIPVSVTSLAETAFMNDSAVKKLTWNAADYPTALGAKTFTTANGFSNGYELHIGADTNALPENFFNAVSSCGDIYFDGENEVLSIPAAASAGAPAPISAIDGMCYVDEYGVVYELSTDSGSASVAYCPPGITEYTVPETITVIGTEIPVTGVNPSAFILARDLQHVTFEDASKITEMGGSAFYGVGTLTQVTDAKTHQTETTVSGARNLFSNVTVSVSVFKNTGLIDDYTDRPWTNGTAAPALALENGEIRLSVSEPVQSSVKGAGYTVDEDGTYQYLTGAYLNTVVSAANDSNHAVTARIYFDFSNVNHIGMDTSFVIEGSNIEVTLHNTDDPDVKFYELRLQEGETASFSLLTTYPSPATSGGDLHIWLTAPESPSEPVGPVPLTPADEYLAALWRTERQDRKVSKTSVQDIKAIGDGEGGSIAGLQAQSWNISLPTTGTIVDSNYGKDYCRQVDLVDMITLPEAVHWNEKILSALASGAFEVRSGISGSNRVNTLYIQNDDGSQSSVLTLSVPTTFTVRQCWVEPVSDDNGTVNNLRVHWSVVPKTENTEMPTGTAVLTVFVNQLELHLDELAEDIADLTFPITKQLVNDVDSTFYYHYSDPLGSSATAQKTMTAPAASLAFTKTRASGTNATYTVYMGMDETFNLKVSNLNTGSTTNLTGVTDPLSQFMYIKPVNMERMFAQDRYGERLTITIQNAQLYDYTPHTAIAMDGTTEIVCDAENSSKDAPVATEQTITIRKADSGYYVCLGDTIVQDAQVFESVQAGLDALGYVVTAGDTYTPHWTFTQENDPFIVYGGLEIPLPIYVSHKTSFGFLTQDWHHHYDCENDWMQTMSNTAHMEYRNALDEGNEVNASCNSYRLRYDFTIGKSLARNGETIEDPSKVNFADGDELAYTISMYNHGVTAYDLPLVDDSTGSQVILVPVIGNETVDWGNSGVPDTYTAADGSVWYVLDRDGEYHHVTVGVDQSGKACVAESVTVHKTYGNLGELSGYDTQIKWYYATFPQTSSTVTRKVTYRALVKTNDNLRYSFHNTAWLNDKLDDRLYAQVGGGGSILTFDKQIVTANANIDGNTHGETIAPNDYLALTEKNHVVTYKIRLSSGGEGEITLTGKQLFDRLPQTFGIFDWTTENITLSYRTDDPEHVTFTGMDDWYIGTDSPIRAFWPDDVEGQFYIRWPQESSIRFTEPADAYLYVTLTYTDIWDAYSAATAGNSVENVIYVNDYPENVVHDIVGTGSAVLQKGVNLIRKAGISKTREYYDNAYSHLEYYVVLYNGGTTRLYLTDMKDLLPRGFAFRRVDPMSDKYYSDSRTNYTTTTYSDWSLENDNAVIPVVMNDNRTIRYKSVKVDATVDGQEVTFHLTGSKTNENYAAFDENYGYYYLRSGEAIVFCYTVAIDTDPENTDDAALNRISMPYLDPQSTGLTVYDDAQIGGKSITDVARNDGNCFISRPAVGVEQLNSEVTVRRGEILPGVNKRLESFTYGGNVYPVISEEDAVDPLADLNWVVETYNEGTAAINGYTISDVMQYPYRFGGEVRYTIYDLDGRSVSSAIYDNTGTIEQALFTITAHSDTAVTLRDIAGRTHTVQINGDPVTLNLPYVYTNYNGVSRTHYTETPYFGNTVLRGTVDVSFSIDPQTNQERMDLTFPESIMIHFPGCIGKLKVTTQKTNTNITNTTYVNTAFFGPEDTAYAAYLVDHGTPLVDDNGDNTGVESYGFVTVRSGWATNSKKTVEEDLRPENKTTSNNPDPVITLAVQQNTFTYGLEVKNTNENRAMDYLMLIDNLPQPDDVYTLQPDIARYSEFAVHFAPQLDLQVHILDTDGNDSVLDPSKYTVEFNEKVLFDDADWNGSGSGWTLVRTEQSRSLRVIIDDRVDASYDGERLMPVGSTVRVTFRAVCGDDAQPGLTAYNSFAYRYCMNSVWLEASPLLVGVRVPDYPYLQKKLVDRFGAVYTTDTEKTFSFLVYQGEAIEGSYADILTALHEAGTPCHIYTVTVEAGKDRSERVKLYPEEDWIWEQDTIYSVCEVPVGRDFDFVRWHTAAGDTLTFRYDREKTQVFIADNRSKRWDLSLTKSDANDPTVKLKDAVFAVYSPNEADRCTNGQLEAILQQQPEVVETYTDHNGESWYLMQLLTTDADGKAQMDHLLEEKYLLLEVQAPVGYHLLTDPLYISSADLEGRSLTLERIVPNDSGYELPMTGGMGTSLFRLGGAACVLAGLLWYALRRKKQKDGSVD